MISRCLRAEHGPEQLPGLLAEPLDVSDVRLAAARQHPGLELLRQHATVAGHHGGGHRLDRDMQVLAPARVQSQRSGGGVLPAVWLGGTERLPARVG
jgi:hypothetical protein